MLADMTSPLEPPSAPFASHRDSTRSFSSGTSPLLKDSDKFSTSLSVNYLPSKFSNAVVTKRKKNGKANGGYLMPKQGGGREAFRSNEARMPGEGDDDYDGIDFNKEGGRTKAKGRWNKFKWCLFLANILVSSQIPSVSPLSSLQSLSSSCRFVPCSPSLTAARTWHTVLTTRPVLRIRPRRSHCLPPHLVQRLDPRRHHPRREHNRTHR